MANSDTDIPALADRVRQTWAAFDAAKQAERNARAAYEAATRAAYQAGEQFRAAQQALLAAAAGGTDTADWV